VEQKSIDTADNMLNIEWQETFASYCTYNSTSWCSGL